VDKQVRRPRNRALLYDTRDFALRSATGPILDDVHRSEATRLKAIELAATQGSEVISIERKALVALLLEVPCRADDCQGHMNLLTITEHGEQGKYLLQCGRCGSSKTFLTHKETGLVMAKIPGRPTPKELSLRLVVSTVLSLMSGLTQKGLNFISQSTMSSAPSPATTDRYMRDVAKVSHLSSSRLSTSHPCCRPRQSPERGGMKRARKKTQKWLDAEEMSAFSPEPDSEEEAQFEEEHDRGEDDDGEEQEDLEPPKKKARKLAPLPVAPLPYARLAGALASLSPNSGLPGPRKRCHHEKQCLDPSDPVVANILPRWKKVVVRPFLLPPLACHQQDALIDDCRGYLLGFHTCYSENAAWQRVSIMQKHRHLPGTAAASSLISSVLANRTYLDTLNLVLAHMGIDPAVHICPLLL
jgi:hypothetical protein